MPPTSNEQTVTGPDGKPVLLPEKYRTRITETTVPAPGKLCLFLQGRVATGKTTVAGSWPRAAYLDFERKAGAVGHWGKDSYRFHFSKAEDYEKMIADLIEDGQKGKRVFDTVVFDTILAYRELKRRSLTTEYRRLGLLQKGHPGDITVAYKSEGAGWDTVNSAVRASLDGLKDAGYAWIVLAHVVPRRAGDALEWESVLNAGILHHVHAQCDYCGYVDRNLTTDKIPQPNRTVAGRSIPTPPKSVTRWTYSMTFLPLGPQLPGREMIPLDFQTLQLEDGNAYTKFSEMYDRAVAVWQEGRTA